MQSVLEQQRKLGHFEASRECSALLTDAEASRKKQRLHKHGADGNGEATRFLGWWCRVKCFTPAHTLSYPCKLQAARRQLQPDQPRQALMTSSAARVREKLRWCALQLCALPLSSAAAAAAR